MANVTKPIALDETFNTTEPTPRNLADVLASGLANIANNVKPDGSDISIDVPGMSANNVNDGFSELKGTFAKYGNISFRSAFNANSIEVDFGFAPSYTSSGQILLFNSNQGSVALFTFGTSPNAIVVFGSKTYTFSIDGTKMIITPNTTLWGITTLLLDVKQ